MSTPLRLVWIGLLVTFIGGLMAWAAHTSGDTIEIRDVRFMGSNGTMMSALLYIPDGVTNENPAPGIVAMHGYINSRETQSPFSIEFARRGYVVLSVDQTGHGFSDPPAFANGFGGPDALAYLRTLDIVDLDNIGLEGHSMGGWAVLIAAGAMPDDYTSIVIEGSSTGTFGAPEGTPEWPRNLAVVFSTWDEFSELMWGAAVAADVEETEKMQTLFGTDEPIEEGVIYGDIEEGTARVLYQPVTTHPGDHLNSVAVANAIEWFNQTLDGGNDLDPYDQVWMWKEIGTLLGLVGMVLTMLGWGGWLLNLNFFSDLKQPLPQAKAMPNGALRYVTYLLLMFIPILTFYWLQNNGPTWFEPGSFWPQELTTGIAVWAIGNGLIMLVLFLIWHFSRNREATLANYGLGDLSVVTVVKSFILAVEVVFCGYILLAAVDFFFLVDFRFWVVAVKLMEGLHFQMFLAYLPAFLFFFFILGATLHGQVRLTKSDGGPVPLWRAMLANVGLVVVGFIVLLLVQYIPLLSGQPLPLGESLLTIVAFQFVPLLTIVAVLSTWFYRLTGRIYVGAFANAMLITWIITASQATHFAF